MEVHQWILRNIIVYHMTNGWDVYSSCSYVCSNQNVFISILKPVHCDISLFLRKIAMNRYCPESFLLQIVCKSLCPLFCGGKNYSLFLVSVLYEVTEVFKFLPLMNNQIRLSYSIKAKFLFV